jgi:hypothetical protein
MEIFCSQQNGKEGKERKMGKFGGKDPHISKHGAG